MLCSCERSSPIQQRELHNGMSIILDQKDDADIVSVLLLVRAGSITDTETTQGLAKLVQTSLFQQTNTSADVQMKITSLAAKYFSGLYPDFAYFGITARSQYLDNILDLVREIIYQSTFSDSLIEAKKFQMQQNVIQSQNNPRVQLAHTFRKALFNHHPYRFSGYGTLETIPSLSLENVREFHQAYYTPANMTLIITGHFNPKEISPKRIPLLDVGEEIRPPVKTWRPQWKHDGQTVVKAVHQYGPDIAFVALGWIAPCIQNKETYATDLLLGCLGIGESSRLNVQVRDKLPGVYYTWAEYITTREPGCFVMNAICHPDQIENVKNAFLNEIKIIQNDSVTPKELQRTKQYFQSLEAYQNEDVVGASFAIGYWAALSDYSFAQNYLKTLREITLKDIQNTSQSYFDLDNYTWCVLMPENE